MTVRWVGCGVLRFFFLRGYVFKKICVDTLPVEFYAPTHRLLFYSNSEQSFNK